MSAANDIRTIIDGILKTPHPAATSAADLHLDDAIDEVAHALAELVDLARAERRGGPGRPPSAARVAGPRQRVRRAPRERRAGARRPHGNAKGERDARKEAGRVSTQSQSTPQSQHCRGASADAGRTAVDAPSRAGFGRLPSGFGAVHHRRYDPWGGSGRFDAR